MTNVYTSGSISKKRKGTGHETAFQVYGFDLFIKNVHEVGETTWTLGILRLKNCNSIERGLDNYCHPALAFHFFELTATSTALPARLSFSHNTEQLEAQVFS